MINFISNADLDQQVTLEVKANLPKFIFENTTLFKTEEGWNGQCFNGGLLFTRDDFICPHCGGELEIHEVVVQRLRHLCFGPEITEIKFRRRLMKCKCCNRSVMQHLPFKADNHKITKDLENYISDLLASNCYTIVEIADLTKVSRHIIKDIDFKRLRGLYTVDGKTLIKPERQARFIAIDEFKLHDGHKFATHIIDLETGHVLWIAKGKKKQVVYDFIEHVGLEWMNNVQAVACDMNSDFEEAFLEKCPHIQIVFDFFHIVKNFNEKVVTPVRIAEQKRLIDEGKVEQANSLKGSKYLLTASRSTLRQKDEEARSGKVVHKGSELFKTPNVTLKEGYEKRYDELIKQNEIFFKLDWVKEALNTAKGCNDYKRLGELINEIAAFCNATENRYFQRFAKLLLSHYTGIVSRAIYHISSGKIEGFNNKVKTMRRNCYGLPDDEYFFLKVMDISRAKSRENC